VLILCVQVDLSSVALKSAADAAIKNFDAMLSYEIAKDPTAVELTINVYGVSEGSICLICCLLSQGE